MALPAVFDTITVKATYVDFTGAPGQGKVTFTPNVDRIKATASDIQILKIPRSVTIGVDGTFTIVLPVTNDPDVLPGFQYSVLEELNGLQPLQSTIEIPIGLLPGPVDLSDLIVIGAVPTGTTALTKNTADLLYAPLGVTDDGLDTAAVNALIAAALVVPNSNIAAKANSSNPSFSGTVSGVTKVHVGLGNVDNTNDLAKPISTAQAAVNTSQAAINAGKADLVGGVIPTSQLPPLAISEVFAPANQTAMLALTAQRGDMAIRADVGKTFVLATDSPSTLADWKEFAAAGQIVSVAGRTGTIVLTKADVSLNNVDNTSDLSKPISTLTQTALDGKAKIGLSYPIISANSSTTVPDRATWIATNCPGYTGPVIWNVLMYLDFVKATVEAAGIDGDIAWRRVSS